MAARDYTPELGEHVGHANADWHGVIEHIERRQRGDTMLTVRCYSRRTLATGQAVWALAGEPVVCRLSEVVLLPPIEHIERHKAEYLARGLERGQHGNTGLERRMAGSRSY